MGFGKSIVRWVIVAGVLLTGADRAWPQTPIGLEAMRRVDLLPQLRPDVRTYQYSSHDPTGGNADSGNVLDSSGSDMTLLDVKGAGCIYRFWFTGDTGGSFRIYFDGSTTAQVNLSRSALFSGTTAPFLSPLVGNDNVSSGGYYCYLPMPFRTGCKIISSGGGHYYNITYQRFPDATGVTTFTGQEDSSAVRSLWSNVGVDPKPDPGTTVVTSTVSLAPSALATLATLTGAGTVQEIELTIPGLSPGDPSKPILAGLRLAIYWDGASQASVDVPAGDFFGSGLGLATAKGLLMGMDGQRLYCYFPMPYANGASIRLNNNGTTTVSNITYKVRYTPAASTPADFARFNARFMSETPTTAGRDYLILQESGAGHFVGVVQTMEGPGVNPPQWYLEGDERIYVDSRATPNLYGTGTEDFFNGGWYFSKGPFNLPTHGAPRMITSAPCANTCYRLFISDLIPFDTAIKVGIEHGATDDASANYRSAAFFYKTAQPMSQLSDDFDVGNASSELAHSYAITGSTWSGSTTGSYEGDDDNVNLSDDGRRLNGTSEFTMTLQSPANRGALLRRRMDYSYARQEARVYVDGVLAGTWYEPGQNTSHIFRDSEFMIPASLTRQKSTIRIRIEKTSVSDWTEYRYWLYTLLPLGPRIALQPNSLTLAAFEGTSPPPASFTVANVGDGTVNYTITTDVPWMTVLPLSGSSTGENDTIDVTYNTTNLAVGAHNGLITVTDPAAVNSPQTLAVALQINPVPGDFDYDLDVDQQDFGHLQQCLTGLGIAPTDPNCADADLDRDGDVDQTDVVIFQGCMSGANLPANPNCAY